MNPVVYLLVSVINLYSFLVIVWAIIGVLIYFNILNRSQPVVSKINEVLTKLIEPALRPIRNVLPDLGGVDVSPVILIILLNFVNYTLIYYF